MLEIAEMPLGAYAYPSDQPRSLVFEVWAKDEPVTALHAEKADFAALISAGPVEIQVRVRTGVCSAIVRPLSKGISALVERDTITFTLPGPTNVCIEVEGQKPLFIYVNAPELRRPVQGASGVHYFAAGQVYEVGKLKLCSGDTLYIEGGAVVRGAVHAANAEDVTICGHGILDGSYYCYDAGDRVRSVVFEHCRNVVIENVILIEPTAWMVVLGRCQDVLISGIRQIGSCMSSDGIDICGSTDVLIEGCCLRNDDDNIVIKALHSAGYMSWEGDVERIRVRNCVLLNGIPGNAMEIGYELRAGVVRDVVFEDIDVISAHGEGAVFSIHNGDRAIVQDVRWENIRVEHYWDKLIDFRVVHSRYNTDAKRGAIRRILLKDIKITRSEFNPGCTVSLIGGYNAEALVDDVIFQDVSINGVKVQSLDELEMFTRHVGQIQVL